MIKLWRLKCDCYRKSSYLDFPFARGEPGFKNVVPTFEKWNLTIFSFFENSPLLSSYQIRYSMDDTCLIVIHFAMGFLNRSESPTDYKHVVDLFREAFCKEHASLVSSFCVLLPILVESKVLHGILLSIYLYNLLKCTKDW